MTGEMIVRLLEETETEILLKDYLKYVEKIFGEDYAISTLTCHYDMAKSINSFSSKFEKTTQSSIMYALLRSFILSNRNDYEKKIINNYIYAYDFEEIEKIIKQNIYFRKSLVRTFIVQSDKTNKELYSKSEDKSLVFEQLSLLRDYERTKTRNYYNYDPYSYNSNGSYNKKKKRFR